MGKVNFKNGTKGAIEQMLKVVEEHTKENKESLMELAERLAYAEDTDQANEIASEKVFEVGDCQARLEYGLDTNNDYYLAISSTDGFEDNLRIDEEDNVEETFQVLVYLIWEFFDREEVVEEEEGEEDGDIIEPTVGEDGYNYVELTDRNGEKHIERVDSLVCATFMKDYTRKHKIIHINGIKTDDRLANLRIVLPEDE